MIYEKKKLEKIEEQKNKKYRADRGHGNGGGKI